MPQYDNTNRWSLFKNDRKEKDTHPDYSGTLNVDGREFWISAWLKDGAKGKFFSGSIKPKEPAQKLTDYDSSPAKQTVTSGKPIQSFYDDEPIPF